MTFNWKVIFIGGLVMYIGQFIASMATGALIHEGVLEGLYKATGEFWRPELRQDPPDTAALMPRWIIVGLAMACVFAAIYDNIHTAFNGSGAVKGLKFGFVLGLISAALFAGWSGVFNLPDAIWAWWAVDTFIYFGVGGLALGWYASRWGG